MLKHHANLSKKQVKKCWILKLNSYYYQGLKSCLSSMLDSCSIDMLSVKVYENKFFRADFTPICE